MAASRTRGNSCGLAVCVYPAVTVVVVLVWPACFVLMSLVERRRWWYLIILVEIIILKCFIWK